VSAKLACVINGFIHHIRKNTSEINPKIGDKITRFIEYPFEGKKEELNIIINNTEREIPSPNILSEKCVSNSKENFDASMSAKLRIEKAARRFMIFLRLKRLNVENTKMKTLTIAIIEKNCWFIKVTTSQGHNVTSKDKYKVTTSPSHNVTKSPR